MNSAPPNRTQFSAWSVCKTLVDPNTGIAVQISCRASIPEYAGAIPLVLYSFQIGRVVEDRLQRNVQAQCLVEQGTVHTVHFNTDALTKLVQEAQEWVRIERQVREDRVIAARAARAEERR